jgi:hypothetical protein
MSNVKTLVLGDEVEVHGYRGVIGKVTIPRIDIDLLPALERADAGMVRTDPTITVLVRVSGVSETDNKPMPSKEVPRA